MQFARENPHINVVGMGAGHPANGDSLEGAMEFAERFGTASAGVSMLYDTSFRSWRIYGVTTQPWSVLFDSSGEQVWSNPGRIDLDSVKAAIG